MPESADREFVSRWPATAGQRMIIGVDKPHIVARQMIAGTRFGVWKCTQQSETVLAAGCGITAEAAFRYALSTASRRIIRE